nr:hypothetical protein [Propionibacterium sp.]
MTDPLARTLNQLEGPTERPGGLSPQGERARDLRDVPLRDLTVADLRTLIVEQQGLAHVVGLALDVLAENPDAAGDRYPGDLLAAVERIPSGFWLTHPALRRRIERLQARRLADLD